MLIEFWEFLKNEQVNTLLSFLTLATTVYFTKTLVDNDNKREIRADVEREDRRDQEIIQWCINEWQRCGQAQGLIQTTGNRLIKKFGNHKASIIADSYDAFTNQNHEARTLQRAGFLELMRQYSDENKLIWPES